MSCWTDYTRVFSQGPIKKLCVLPAAHSCECVLNLNADTEALKMVSILLDEAPVVTAVPL